MTEADKQAPSGWSSILESLPHGLMLVSSAGIILKANGAASGLLGIRKAMLEGLPFTELRDQVLSDEGAVGEFSRSRVAVSVNEGCLLVRSVVGVLTPAQDTIWLMSSVRPLPEGGVIVTFDDVTRQRNTEAILAARARINDVAATERARLIASTGASTNTSRSAGL